MRKNIAAANWKMNLTPDKAALLLQDMKSMNQMHSGQLILLALPFPYLEMGIHITGNQAPIFIAAQNLSQHSSGAYTGETSAEMLAGMGIRYVLIGHSERREYFNETSDIIAAKVRQALNHHIIPVFCCGEPLHIRDSGQAVAYVTRQLEEELFSLNEVDFRQVIIAYEPIWAIGTGRTASDEQAQDMHHQIRHAIQAKYGLQTAAGTSILYGGSVKAANAKSLFSLPDVDGGLVGGASLIATEFKSIAAALKQA